MERLDAVLVWYLTLKTFENKYKGEERQSICFAVIRPSGGMADTRDLKSLAFKSVSVRVRSWALAVLNTAGMFIVYPPFLTDGKTSDGSERRALIT